MQSFEQFPFSMAAAMLVAGVLLVPMLGWWPMAAIIAAIISAAILLTKLGS